MLPRTVSYQPGCVRLLDQTLLPGELSFRDVRDIEDLVDSIRRLRVRGAPAIGVAAAYGVCLAADCAGADRMSPEGLRESIRDDIRKLGGSRPTAVNLSWALQRMSRCLDALPTEPFDPASLKSALVDEADAIREEDEELCRALGGHGAELLPDEAVILTHCNAGALATAGMGTALAVVYAAVAAGKKVSVIADETRPLLQGARLTAWELMQQGVEVTVICDGAAGWTLSQKKVDAVIVGADRIAANGDSANKIGTYPLAVLARRHQIPFYVVAPYSTLDLSIPTGREIPIELRSAEEVLSVGGHVVAAPGAGAFNPAFDVTDAELITAIITERGVHRFPFEKSFSGTYSGKIG